MKIPEPKTIKGKNGRIIWKYKFKHYLVRINKFPGDDEVFVSVSQDDKAYPDVSKGLSSNFFVTLSSGIFTVSDREYALKMINEAFDLAELLENNLEKMTAAE